MIFGGRKGAALLFIREKVYLGEPLMHNFSAFSAKIYM